MSFVIKLLVWKMVLVGEFGFGVVCSSRSFKFRKPIDGVIFGVVKFLVLEFNFGEQMIIVFFQRKILNPQSMIWRNKCL